MGGEARVQQHASVKHPSRLLVPSLGSGYPRAARQTRASAAAAAAAAAAAYSLKPLTIVLPVWLVLLSSAALGIVFLLLCGVLLLLIPTLLEVRQASMSVVRACGAVDGVCSPRQGGVVGSSAVEGTVLGSVSHACEAVELLAVDIRSDWRTISDGIKTNAVSVTAPLASLRKTAEAPAEAMIKFSTVISTTVAAFAAAAAAAVLTLFG